MKQILVAEPEQAVNKKAFAIDTVVGDCSAAHEPWWGASASGTTDFVTWEFIPLS